MLKGSTTKIPYDDIDYELRDVIRYMNSIDGIETTECCCGHGENPCYVWFKADNAECLSKFWHKYLYCDNNWHIVFYMSDTDIDNGEWDKPTYLLETTFPDYYYVGMAIDNLKYRMKNENEMYECPWCGIVGAKRIDRT